MADISNEATLVQVMIAQRNFQDAGLEIPSSDFIRDLWRDMLDAARATSDLDNET